jgi:hypothetical protein
MGDDSATPSSQKHEQGRYLVSPLWPINSMGAILAALLLRLSSALSHLVKMPTDLLFGAAELSKSFLNLPD